MGSEADKIKAWINRFHSDTGRKIIVPSSIAESLRDNGITEDDAPYLVAKHIPAASNG